MSKHLAEKDIRDAKDIAELFESLDDESKKIILVYAGALRDKQMLDQKRSA